MRNFSVPPAFGWQTAKMNADDYYEKNIGIGSKNVNKKAKHKHRLSNFVKVLGYVPALGTLIGVGRIISVIRHRKDSKGKLNQTLRAGVEISGLGPVLFIVDLGKHIFRHHSLNKNKEPKIKISL